MSPAWCCGPLLHVLPTAAACLTYEQHEHNEQMVRALHHSLQERDEALVCTLHHTPHTGVSITPRVVLYPAPHGVLAMSCLVPRELWLPQVLPPPGDNPDPQVSCPVVPILLHPD
ncbi:uncharacterized protein LOC125177651 [Hyalella azteca]|uniref:Uncharacterized protein LOC125177651 n=1 Tax=Hyalella azteca TaxID=294128 RepID=A0A979FGB5_HYAAZ|nr:uncharacterized protein LOC125177651 [Hyalella azteca]